MPRPAHADAEATRRRILSEARALFAAGAESDVSVRQIARAAGVSVAMIHHYYGSKDELYTACVASMYEELAGMLAVVGSALREPPSLREVLPAAARDAFQFARAQRPLVRFLIRHLVEGGTAPAQGNRLLAEFLDMLSAHIGSAAGRPPEAVRLPLQSMLFLVARYAAQDDAALCLSAGVPPGAVDEAVARVEAHLMQTALELLVHGGTEAGAAAARTT